MTTNKAQAIFNKFTASNYQNALDLFSGEFDQITSKSTLDQVKFDLHSIIVDNFSWKVYRSFIADLDRAYQSRIETINQQDAQAIIDNLITPINRMINNVERRNLQRKLESKRF